MINMRNTLIVLVVLFCSLFYSRVILAEGGVGVSVGVSTDANTDVEVGGDVQDKDTQDGTGALTAQVDTNAKPRTSAYLHTVLDSIGLTNGVALASIIAIRRAYFNCA